MRLHLLVSTLAWASKKAKRLALATKKTLYLRFSPALFILNCLFGQDWCWVRSQIINYLSKKIPSSLHISRISFSSAAPHTFLFFRWISIRRRRCFPLFKWSKCKQNSFSRHCSAHLSAMKVWVNTEHAQQSFTASASRGQHLSAFIRKLLRPR